MLETTRTDSSQTGAPIADLGPLAWVFDELRKSLEGANKAIKRFVRETEKSRNNDLEAVDPNSLRVARQQLHQAVGALEMVGLAAPAQVLRAMEAAVQRFVQRPNVCDEDAAERVERASFALVEYLEAVLNNKPVQPVALFVQYREVQELAAAERIHPADLWSFDQRGMELTVPANTAPLKCDAAMRSLFDRLVLLVVKTHSLAGAVQLSKFSAGLSAGATSRREKTFWHITAAYFEAVAHQLLPDDVYVKRAASRILLQFASLAQGQTQVSEVLLHDLLFFCAQARGATASLAPYLVAVRKAYGLEATVPVNYEQATLGRYDPAILAQARKRINAAKESWSLYSGGDASRARQVVDQFGLIGESLLKLHPASTVLAQALLKAADQAAHDPAGVRPELAMEVATTTLYLEAAFEDFDPNDAEMTERTQALAQRLEYVRSGAPAQPLDPWMEQLYRRVSDRQTMGSVVGELKVSLGEAEKSLDQFFRAPKEKACLHVALSQLAQMRGVLSVLGLDQAVQTVVRMRATVDQMLDTEVDKDLAREAGTFQQLGNNLSALSFLVDMLNYQPLLAKKLFVFDAEKGELLSLMGRQQAPVPPTVSAPEPVVDRSAELPEAFMGLQPDQPVVSAQPLSLQVPNTAAAVQQVAAVPELPPQPAPAVAPAPVPAPAPTAAPVAAPASETSEEEDELLDIFLEEAREVVGNGLEAVRSLKVQPGHLEDLTTLRRAFHTLKGSSRMVGLAEFGEAAWAMEQLVNASLAEQRSVHPHMLSLSADAMHAFSLWVEDIASHQASAWQAQPFRTSAEAWHKNAQYIPLQCQITSPESAAAPAAPEPAAPAAPTPEAQATQVTERATEQAVEQATAPTTEQVAEEPAPVWADVPAEPQTEPDAAPPEWQATTPAEPQADTLDLADTDGVLDISLDSLAPDAPVPDTVLADLPGVTDVQAVPDVPDVPAVPDAQDVEELVFSLSNLPQEPAAPEALPADAGADAGAEEAATANIEYVDFSFFDEALKADAAPVAAEADPQPVQPVWEALPLVSPEALPPEAPSPVPAEPVLVVESFDLDLADLAFETAPPLDPLPDPLPEQVPEPLSELPLEPQPEPVQAAQAPAPAESPWPAQPVAAAAPPAPPAPPEPTESLDPLGFSSMPDEQTRVIGRLRIGIKLYNVYLNEADEWSRRLDTAVAEWALESHLPVPDHAESLAHSLAGSSAAVGFQSLSDIARALEHAFESMALRQQAGWVATADQVALFVAASEDIRRLLHQFAAGFLQDPKPELIAALYQVVHEPMADEVPQDTWDALDTLDVLDPTPAPSEAPRWSMEPAPTAQAPAVLAAPAPGAWVQAPPAPAVEPAPVRVPLAAPAAPAPAVAVAVAVVPQAAPVVAFAAPEIPAPQAVAAAEPLPRPAGSAAVQDIDDDIDVLDTIDVDLFPIFADEAHELLPMLEAALRQWVARPDNGSARGEVLRLLHTLKGSARLSGALRLGEMVHRMETTAERLGSDVQRSADLEPLQSAFDAIVERFEQLNRGDMQAQGAVVQAPEQASAPEPVDVMRLLAEQADAATPASTAAASATAPEPETGLKTLALSRLPTPVQTRMGAAVRVRSELLDRLVNQIGEVMITRSRMESELVALRGSLKDLTGNLDRLRQQLRDIELQAESQMQSRLALARDVEHAFDPLEFDRFTRVQELTRMMAESVNDVATVQRNLQRAVESTEDGLVAQARQTRELQRDLLRTRMVEFEGISERLYRVVRLASKETGKLVRLDITGGQIEMDRGVLDRVTAAFEHLLRNCVVHGIETPEQRVAAGKPAEGLIGISLAQELNDVSVVFSDDGAGLNLSLLREKAVARGFVAPGAVISDEAAAQLVFAAGLSTVDQVSELAGRGVGMDVVRNDVLALGGRIETSTQPGQGTTFKLVLPLTTAVTQVVMLRAGALTLGVPSTLVELVRRITSDELAQAYAKGTLTVGEQEVPFYWGGALLLSSAQSEQAQGRTLPVVIFRSAAQRVAMHVDEVLGNQEVVVKNLGPQLSRLPGLAGMSVLASGAVALIYNPVALSTVYGAQVRAWLATHQRSAQPVGDGGTQTPVQPVANAVPLVLVVDDSITVRRVTQRLLQREGFRVSLAADGLQALERLQQERPTVVLSDIEMPRMDGFDLLRNIRGDARLKALPVIMITSRIADKHREHARELGADHYLGKPYPEDELLALIAHYAKIAAEA
jgi:chemosensory pili system protein ChpA (sensor histidine kinase/response regulator)